MNKARIVNRNDAIYDCAFFIPWSAPDRLKNMIYYGDYRNHRYGDPALPHRNKTVWSN